MRARGCIRAKTQLGDKLIIRSAAARRRLEHFVESPAKWAAARNLSPLPREEAALKGAERGQLSAAAPLGCRCLLSSSLAEKQSMLARRTQEDERQSGLVAPAARCSWRATFGRAPSELDTPADWLPATRLFACLLGRASSGQSAGLAHSLGACLGQKEREQASGRGRLSGAGQQAAEAIRSCSRRTLDGCACR